MERSPNITLNTAIGKPLLLGDRYTQSIVKIPDRYKRASHQNISI